ncbi:NCS1 nucleoside transporter family [Motilibacter rhizosphaerae]|uniref:NCS1 nucleoside transporter family n=1 Tax=Motilibacter rhizosphaerae TaxID=598652 RepID=A0A4V2F560_9ACTN|nr:cytosine permease [Motilibacter rhizosphaerae]RZS91689.1 NCS1 nucleoside transporter family [Motilibacter rhizosphaerae]
MTATAAPGSDLAGVDLLELREGSYGTRIAAVEPGGAEAVPPGERHGTPVQLLWTWMSPNLEFATVFVGVIGVAFFGLTFWEAASAIVVGSALGGVTQGILSARGPEYGVPQMILSRIPFGWFGNLLPAGLNAVTAGIGWFAVNSVSGALALASLTSLPDWLCLVVVVIAQLAVAFLGHNMVHAFERWAFPVLGIVFAVTTVVILSKSHPGASGHHGGIGGWLVLLGATFGYAAGWNPYAADYTRYLPRDVSKAKVAVYAGLGVFISCTVLEIAGAASMTIGGAGDGSPTSQFVAHLPTWLGKLTLLCIALGAVSANAINIYSGAISFLALGIKLPLSLRRAIVAVGFGTIGFILALTSLDDAGEKYEDFLLVIAYWIGPWLGVYFTDWFLRRRQQVAGLLFNQRHNPFAGWVAMAVGMAVSIGLFSNQTKYKAPLPSHHPALGDLTFEVGFAVAALLYAAIATVEARRTVRLPA